MAAEGVEASLAWPASPPRETIEAGGTKMTDGTRKDRSEWDSSSDEEVLEEPTSKTFTPTSTPQKTARYALPGWYTCIVYY